MDNVLSFHQGTLPLLVSIPHAGLRLTPAVEAGLVDAALPAASVWPVLFGLGMGLTLMLAFGLPPVLQLAQVPPLRVIRRDVGQLKPASLAVLALVTLPILPPAAGPVVAVLGEGDALRFEARFRDGTLEVIRVAGAAAPAGVRRGRAGRR